MEKNYTDGPWYPVNYSGYIRLQSTPFYENTELLNEESCDKANANAILAASAPDLLQALQECVKLPYTMGEPYRIAKHAIDKALGRTAC